MKKFLQEIKKYYVKSFKDFATYSGRARRKEYWGVAIINSGLIYFFGWIFFAGALLNAFGFGVCLFLYILVLIAIMAPTLAVGVRRMHDVGKSGWFLLIPIYNFILAVTQGTKGENQYGQDPKNIKQTA